MFMAGPTAQLKTMCAPKRRVSTIIYVLALALTLFFAFATQVPDGARFGCILASLFIHRGLRRSVPRYHASEASFARPRCRVSVPA